MIRILITADDVKAEAARRILLVAPAHKQANDAARATELLEIGIADLTEGQMEEYRAIRARRRLIDHYRAVSNRLEVAPIPLDFKADLYWEPDHG